MDFLRSDCLLTTYRHTLVRHAITHTHFYQTTHFIEVVVECVGVVGVELGLLIEDVSQVFVPLGLQCVLGQRPRQPHGLPQYCSPVTQLAGQIGQRVEDGRRVLRGHQLLLL